MCTFFFLRRKLLKPTTLKPQKALSTSWSYLKRIFTSKSCKITCTNIIQSHLSTPPRSSNRCIVSLVLPDPDIKYPPGSFPESGMLAGSHQFFPLRNDIFPCTARGEIFPKPETLDHHQAIHHAVFQSSMTETRAKTSSKSHSKPVGPIREKPPKFTGS